MLKQHQGLRDLKERRRREQTEAKLADSKPLEDILESLLKKSPTLGEPVPQRATAPRTHSRRSKSRGGRRGEAVPRQALPDLLQDQGPATTAPRSIRETPINMRSRITFETDAENEYFGRTTETGEFSLFFISGDEQTPVTDYVGPNLQNGIGTLSVQLPTNCQRQRRASFSGARYRPVAVGAL